MENPEFLKEKYGLHKSSEVERAAKRAEQRTGQKLPTGTEQAADIRIENYLDRLKNIIYPQKLKGHDQFDRQRRNIEMLKHFLHNQFVIKTEEIPEAYFESIKRRHREEGHGDIEIPGKLKKELADTLIAEQRDSLDAWIDYLTSQDAKYPHDLKYWAIRSILQMGRYDKEREKFTTRYGGAVSPFPELNQEALALVFEAMENKRQGKAHEFGYDINEETKKKFIQALQGGNFAKLYGLAIQEFNPIAEELLKVTKGKWITYSQGSDPELLVKSLRRRGTGWCIAGEPTAKRYLEGNDLEIFYSLDRQGNPTIPRVVIVSSGGRISEVRGVSKQENLDSHISPVVEAKLNELPDGKSFEKKTQNMKTLTVIEQKSKAGEPFTKNDLLFLYEVNSTIEGFGYQRDPRIQEIKKQRNPKEDAPIVLDCKPEEIAWSRQEISDKTKAYIGPLFPGVFKTDIRRIYTSFPEAPIRIFGSEIGGKTSKELEREIKEKGINIYNYAQDMLRDKGFTTLKSPEKIKLVRLKVRDLGFESAATTEQIYRRAEEFGLELCPAEVGPNLRLQYVDQPPGEWIYIAMKQIPDRDGSPSVFALERHGNGLWLDSHWTRPEGRWDPDDGFVFSLRKLNP